MIRILKGNIFNSKCDCIVNTVNCVGFMGKGIALEMSLRYPEMEAIYKEKCRKGEIQIGELWIYEEKKGEKKKILNFPTKKDYKKPSKEEYILKGLEEFRKKYRSYGIKSIAFPLLGAQNGKLSSGRVLEIMKQKLGDLEDLEVEIYVFDLKEYVRDSLFMDFVSYLEMHAGNPKNARIKEAIKMRSELRNFADIVEMKIPFEEEGGGVRRVSIATKTYIQKIVSEIKNSGKQMSLF
ncbi:MAG: macro domain-containing protein [Candidatus Saccharibacteria bacterium]|nr:macro domain-containing protein [Candidatus Saccharibacteria bacterium]